MAAVRTRFAPSPTGFLHLGSARTALFNWAYARRHAGALVLRIEDTDRERSTRESEAALVEGLAWLGIDWDEGPFRQSERRERHDAVVDDLLAKGHAYRCICSREELEARKQAVIAGGGKWTYDGRCRDAGHGPGAGPHAVRLRLPEVGRYAFDDVVFGESGQDVREIGDRIIRRSDGAPLFHLAVVVDDVDMGITHVIRGADHHINTPFQLALYEAIGARPPVFAHVPLIVGESGKKLSKRRDAVAIEHYRAEGFLPEALCNWIVRLGWSHGDQEIFSREEIAELFDLGSVHRAPAQADTAKLLHLGQHWIKALPMDALFPRALPFLEAQAGGPVARTPELERLVDLLRERSRTLAELSERARFALVEEIAWDEAAARKHLRPEAAEPLADLHDRLAALPAWNEAAIEGAFRAVCESRGGLALGKLAQPVRVAVTGSAASPGIFETLFVLGRERSLRRIADAVHAARHGG